MFIVKTSTFLICIKTKEKNKRYYPKAINLDKNPKNWINGMLN